MHKSQGFLFYVYLFIILVFHTIYCAEVHYVLYNCADFLNYYLTTCLLLVIVFYMFYIMYCMDVCFIINNFIIIIITVILNCNAKDS